MSRIKLTIIVVLVMLGIVLFVAADYANNYRESGYSYWVAPSIRSEVFPYQVYVFPLIGLGLVSLIAGIVTCFVPEGFFQHHYTNGED